MAITNDTLLDPSIDRRLAVDLDASESDRLEAYLDTRGNWTAGRGHLLPPPAPGRSWKGFTVPQSTSDRWFSTDIVNAMRLATRWAELESCDTACRKNALYELAFNMGGRWEEFGPTRADVKAKEWQAVHDHLLESLWAKEVQPDGLDKPGRATRIANYFLSGEYPNG
jgi:GH24 family phage-related lysozyme (muramidase)